VLTDTTADYVWALLLNTVRRTVEGYEYVLDDDWETWGPKLLTGPDVSNATLGSIGLGNIGYAVVKRSTACDMEVLYSDVERWELKEAELREHWGGWGVDITHVDQDEVLAMSDFVSLDVPLMDAARHLISDDELRMMREDVILVNNSGGR